MKSYWNSDPLYRDVFFQAPLQAHIRDTSILPSATTAYGNTLVLSDCTYFDGDGDYILLASSVAAALATGPVTVEFEINPNQTWVRPTGNNGDYGCCVLAQNNNQGSGEQYINIGTDNQIYFVRAASWSPSYGLYSVGRVPRTSWTHVAFVFTGTELRLFLNGKLDNKTSATTFWGNNGLPLELARNLVPNYSSYSSLCNGRIRNVRFTKGVRYLGDFTPPKTLSTHGVPVLNRRIPVVLSEARRPPVIRSADRALNPALGLSYLLDAVEGRDAITAGTVVYTGSTRSVGPYGIRVVHDATSNLTSLASDERNIISADGDLTLFMHLYPWGYGASSTHGFGVLETSYDASFVKRCGTYMPYSDNVLYWDYGGAIEGTTRLSIAMPQTTPRSTWAFTVGSRGMEIWHNGVRIANNSARPTRTAAQLAFSLGNHGYTASPTSNQFDCYLFGICRKQLPYELLQKLTSSPESMRSTVYGGASRLYPIPTRANAAKPIGMSTRRTEGQDPYYRNVLLDFGFSRDTTDRSLYKRSIALYNGAAIAGEALQLSATFSHYAVIPYSSEMNIGSADFTIDFWGYKNVVSSTHKVAACRWSHDSASEWRILCLGDNSDRVSVSVKDAIGAVSGPLASVRSFPLNLWTHIAVTMFRGNLYLFMDGVLEAKAAMPYGAFYGSCTDSINIGRNEQSSVWFWPGAIRDFRFLKGTARWITDFTPPPMLRERGSGVAEAYNAV